MTKYTGRSVLWVFAFAALVLAFRCDPTSVRVVQDGVPVAGAEVYANNRRIGLTDASGVLAFPQGLAPGTALVARKKIFERPGFRPNHGPENDGLSWTERVYLTSVEVRNDGTLSPPWRVTEPNVQQTLTLKTDNVLIGVHFMVSVIWDASDAELLDVKERFRQASDFIYNATDGQVYFEQVDIVDDNTFWNDAEYHWHADTAVWPATSNFGTLLVPNAFGGVVEMSRRTQMPDGSDARVSGPDSIAHEFGHLGFGLLDEYTATTESDSNRVFCAEHLHDMNPDFGRGMAKASCVMYDPSEAKKFCSNHPDNPHHRGLLQISSCWENIVFNFSHPTADRLTPASWTLKTPDTRGAIVGQVQSGIPADWWQPRINIDNRAPTGLGSLCESFVITVRYLGDVPAMNFPISLAVGPRVISEGPTGADGSVKIVGAHVGDRVWTGLWRNVLATPSLGPNTCGAP
jgi:hypothetical protein